MQVAALWHCKEKTGLHRHRRDPPRTLESGGAVSMLTPSLSMGKSLVAIFFLVCSNPIVFPLVHPLCCFFLSTFEIHRFQAVDGVEHGLRAAQTDGADAALDSDPRNTHHRAATCARRRHQTIPRQRNGWSYCEDFFIIFSFNI